MLNKEYTIAYREVIEILKYISTEEYKKIPKNKIELFEKNADKNYKFKYDPKLTLDEQGVSQIGKTIITILFRDYWATDIQREKIIAKQNYYREKLEDEKRKKYDPNDLFKNTRISIKDEIETNFENALVERKIKWYQKKFEKLLNIFKR